MVIPGNEKVELVRKFTTDTESTDKSIKVSCADIKENYSIIYESYSYRKT